jgi:hypothetical protein
MRFFAYMNQLVRDSASIRGGFHPQAMYIFLNLVVPLALGLLLSAGIKIVNWIFASHEKRNN